MVYFYVVECEAPGYYYVGRTNDLQHRFNQHRTGKGSKWCRMFGAKKIVEEYNVERLQCSNDFKDKSDENIEAGGIENRLVRRCFVKYGIDKVRGGKYKNDFTISDNKNWLLINCRQICDRCGIAGIHDSSSCKYETDWKGDPILK